MMEVPLLSFCLLLSSGCANILAGAEEEVCGFPGLPIGGQLLLGGDGGIQTSSPEGVFPGAGWPAGARVGIACSEGRVRQGEDERECNPDGSWAGNLPLCRTNLARDQPALQSETLLNYAASMAVDGDEETCSFTPRTLDQRWWQIQIEATVVQSVAVAISPGSFQHFTIFVIELMEGNKALYKPCATWRGEFEEAVAVFLCNDGDGHRGEFVYIRDDREQQEYFGLCEVQVFPIEDGSLCGKPELPLGGQVQVDNGEAVYSCSEGRTLRGTKERRCSNGQWSGEVPTCHQVECGDPVSPKSGYIEVSNFRGRYQYGAVATYRCNPGHILWGNASRSCKADGTWEGSAPSCNPVSCGNPPAVVNGVVELVNGTTAWQSIAKYTCLPSFSNYGNENTTNVSSTCLESGGWSPVSFTCMFDPTAVSRNIKRGRSLYWEENGTMNTSTMITIGVLSSLIVLSLIVTIIVISHRKATSAANSRKISRSSTNQLIHEALGEDECSRKCGVIVYDDLNHPHMVEADHEILAHYSTPTIKKNRMRGECLKDYQATLSTFSLGSPPGIRSPPGSVLGIRSPLPETPGIHQARSCDNKSPLSERSSGDGGSDRETCGHYATVGRLRKRSEEIYSSMRRPDGESDDDPYSSIRVRRDSGDPSQHGSPSQASQSPGQTSQSPSTTSQATVRLAREDGGEMYSKVDPTELYARVDPAKKRKRDSGASSTSPDSPSDSQNISSPVAFSPEPLSPTRALIQRFNEGQKRGLMKEEEDEVVYEEVGPRRPPVPLPRTRGGSGGGATSPDM